MGGGPPIPSHSKPRHSRSCHPHPHHHQGIAWRTLPTYPRPVPSRLKRYQSGLTGATLVSLSSFSFNDGAESFTLDASTADYFLPYTDASGDLTSFFLDVVTSLPGSTPANLYTNDLILSYGPAFTGMVRTAVFEDRTNQSTAYAQTLSDGTLTPTSINTTPEPSSLALLATGAFGIAGMLRYRRRPRIHPQRTSGTP